VNLVAMIVLGAGTGAGLLLIRRAVAPRPAPLGDVLAQLARPGVPLAGNTAAVDGGRLPRLARRVLDTLGVDSDRHQQALELVGRTPERHALDKLLGSITGLLVPNLVGAALAVLDIGPPLGLIVALSLATAAAGFVLPDLLLKDAADRRRQSFRHALSSYLDLVNVLLAGGAGIETALHAAADAGDGWGYATIRTALQRSRLTGLSPWSTFAELADRLGVDELAELAANVSLAGSHGARIRASLAAKADTLRGHQVAETEAAAEAATERMTIPVAVLLFGFLLFIAYPAVAQITNLQAPQP
jgi:tight adherence protein C